MPLTPTMRPAARWRTASRSSRLARRFPRRADLDRGRPTKHSGMLDRRPTLNGRTPQDVAFQVVALAVCCFVPCSDASTPPVSLRSRSRAATARRSIVAARAPSDVAHADALEHRAMRGQGARLRGHETIGDDECRAKRRLDGSGQSPKHDVVACSDDARMKLEISFAAGLKIGSNVTLYAEVGLLYPNKIGGGGAPRGESCGCRFDDAPRLDQARDQSLVASDVRMPGEDQRIEQDSTRLCRAP